MIARRIFSDSKELSKRPLLEKNQKMGGDEVDFEELLGSLKKLFEERVSYYRQVDKIVRDDYSSAEICARNIYYSILS